MVAKQLSAVRTRLEAAAMAAGRSPGGVTLVAVSKGQPLDLIRAAYDAGHRDFGENRASELVEKAAALPTDIHWHMVGHLQRNKVKLVRPIAVLLHSLDSVRLAAAWSKGGSAPPVLVEVNLAAEPQKSGVVPTAAADLVDAAMAAGADVKGLMALPPLTQDPAEARFWFAALAELRSQLGEDRPSLVELSMGMTDDFELAVAEGATIVRVGRAIFGPRQ